MPIVQIHLMEGRDKKKKSAMVKQVTEAICDSLGVLPKNVRIIISDMKPHDYSIGGELVGNMADPFGNKAAAAAKKKK